MDDVFRLFHFYPHFTFGGTRLFDWIEQVFPLAPDRTRVVTRLFSHKSRSGSLKGRLLCP